MLTRRYSAAELAAHTGLPKATLGYFVGQGALRASVQRAEGRGQANVFDFSDAIAAFSLNSIRLPNVSAKPLRRLVAFWHSTRGRALIETLVDQLGRVSDEPCVVLITDKCVALDTTPAALMKEGATVVFCIDARRMVEWLFARSSEAQIRHEFVEPGPSGRVPRTKRHAPTAEKAKMPARNRASLRAEPKHASKKSRGRK